MISLPIPSSYRSFDLQIPLINTLETLDTPVSYKGDLILALKYAPPDVTSRKFSKRPDLPVKGSLEVLVREARNLMATRSNGTSDPFCKR
ncbi:synaptotagmin-like protein 4 [Trichonephila inaurata madagascariensis]|uniref:Synaptotagmin-like protein 4 n=1 Tax=Trichonephila inaurata madagascariensis TaxID=2747483 RepID=A0A8X6I5E7_9ARAC|nr:synaptotagmin-like protein 4 [Trichonephila inaurata madagascariensis]